MLATPRSFTHFVLFRSLFAVASGLWCVRPGAFLTAPCAEQI
jgi:hypothetical protein